ncbi:GAF domain-containing protein [Geomonas sp.]|uniref:GAF domain-containing protein n=1 Tax=Geomonas sp. TaxID=2651584 RepID=UPI002B48C5BF|nr:GAF domain-containing protein [Geomonas sp.]HJV36805.1 GAF domain-containing protein [Geomonas sp.]
MAEETKTREELLAEIAELRQAHHEAEEHIRRLSGLYAVARALDQAIVQGMDRDAIFREFCRVAVELGGYRLAWVGLLDRENGLIRPVVAFGETGFLEGLEVSIYDQPNGQCPTGISVRQQSYHVCNDFQNALYTYPWWQKAREYGLKSSASIAICQNREVVGAMSLYAGEKDAFDLQHVELLQQMGEDISFALDHLLLEARVREAQLEAQLAREREQAEEALRLSEEKFSLAFARNPAGIALTRLEDGVLLEMNETWLGLHGYRRDEVLGQSVWKLPIWPNLTEPLRFVQELKEKGWVAGREQAFLNKDGEQFVAELSAQVLTVRGEEVILSTMIDITSRINAEAALKELNEELEIRVALRTAELADHIEMLKSETAERIRAVEELRQNEQLLIHQSRLAALGEMIGNIAHQWRQPLNALGLLIQEAPLLYEAGQLSPELLEESTDKAMVLIKHMSSTIDDFRNFFRSDKEKVSFRVREELSKTLSLIEAGFKAKHIKIEVQGGADPVIHGYPNEFSQALLNILLNARDALAERKVPRPRVLVAVTSEDERAVVAITDNAGGIPDEIIGKVFEPYFTTKGPQAGTGVGLFMSKNIIEKNMGGRLTVCNVEQGACFRIEMTCDR